MSVNTTNHPISLEDLISKCCFNQHMYNANPYAMKPQYLAMFLENLTKSVLANKVTDFNIKWEDTSKIIGDIKFRDCSREIINIDFKTI